MVRQYLLRQPGAGQRHQRICKHERHSNIDAFRRPSHPRYASRGGYVRTPRPSFVSLWDFVFLVARRMYPSASTLSSAKRRTLRLSGDFSKASAHLFLSAYTDRDYEERSRKVLVRCNEEYGKMSRYVGTDICSASFRLATLCMGQIRREVGSRRDEARVREGKLVQ
jgi:hypothetical protein